MNLTAGDRSSDFRTDGFRFGLGGRRRRFRALRRSTVVAEQRSTRMQFSVTTKTRLNGASEFAFRLSKRVHSVEAFALNRRQQSLRFKGLGGDIPSISNGGVRPSMVSTTARAAVGEPVNPIQGKKMK